MGIFVESWIKLHMFVGGTIASWLEFSTLNRLAHVQALPRDIMLCSWVKHSTLSVLLPTQVYKGKYETQLEFPRGLEEWIQAKKPYIKAVGIFTGQQIDVS